MLSSIPSVAFLSSFFSTSSIMIPGLPPWYMYGMVFLMGAVVGSFLNVCILRIPEEGVTIFYPSHSRCPTCGYTLRWYDNVPILSYLLLRAKCRSCKTGISAQYPLVELATAVLAVAVMKRFGFQWVSLVLFVFICALIVITFIDLAFWIIPDVISLPGILLGVAVAFFFTTPPIPSWQSSALGAVAGGGSLLAISLFYEHVMKRTGMGMGDVKLLAMIGAFLGIKALPLVILLSALQGLLIASLMFLLGWREGAPEFEEDFEKEEDGADESEEATPKAVKLTQSTELSEKDVVSSDTKKDVDISEPDEVTPELGDESADDSDTFDEDEDVGYGRVAIPFGPFLALAALEYLFWGPRLYYWWMGIIEKLVQSV